MLSKPQITSSSILSDRRKHQPQFDRPVSVEARKYAIKELARRAGVSQEFFKGWKIDVANDHTVVSLVPDGNKKIYFDHTSGETLRAFANGRFSVARGLWLSPPSDPTLTAPLCIPFAEPDAQGVQYFFQSREDGAFSCKYDILLSLLFTLSRVEESLSDICDEHGRFPASASLAIQHNFLERPIVDEYGLAFEQVIRALLPAWRAERRVLRMKLTHDIDDIGIPFQIRTAAAHTLKRGKPLASFRDLASTISNTDPAELSQVRALADVSCSRGLHSAFYWKGSARTAHDSGYDPLHPKVQRALAYIKDQGFEVGVHPGYDTFCSRAELAQEVERLRSALGVEKVGGRQHYLRWSPQTWHDWEDCKLSYDSSVGFADFHGFRAGTAIPYAPWSFAENRELTLIEIPLTVMDCTPVKYMRLPKIEGLSRIQNCIKRTALVGGVFTLLWHNTPLLEPEYDGWYEPILDMLANAKNFELPVSAQLLW